MSRQKIDMTGWIMKEHGVPDSKLTVLYELPERKNGSIVWHCKCDCGNECDVRGDRLKSGNTKSCGCHKKQQATKQSKINAEQKFIDLAGQDFGYWHIIKRVEGQNDHPLWLCQCKCGTIKIMESYNLKSGRSQSCGCLNMSHGEKKIKDLLEPNNIKFKKEKTFDNCKFEDTNIPARFDFYVNNQYIIEYDGEQHFHIHSWWNTIKTQEHDKFKNQYCFDNNIPIIRIPYTHLNDICLEDLIPETSQFLLK